MKLHTRFFAFILIGGMLLSACAPESPAAPSPIAESIYAPIVSNAPEEARGLRIGIVIFLTGEAAEPFGIPARDGAQAMIESLNSGQAPAPYDTPGIGGVPIVPIYVDEAGGPEQQVAELRRLFEVEQVDLVIGYISSGDCLAVAPVAEELQKLTIAFDCGTSRLFEERDYHYVFRTNAHQAIDSLGGARYLLQHMPDLQTVAGINPNYSWGQDSWAHFRDTLAQLRPEVQVLSEQFPKLYAGDYTAEIEALGAAAPQVVHTSFWGGDLGKFVEQAAAARLFASSTVLMSVGESGLPQLGRLIPPGTIIGAHGPHGVMAPDSEMNTWLVQLYTQRYGARPTYPVYHMAQALLGIKLAYEQAALAQDRWPTTEEVIAAFEYLEYPTPSGVIRMAIGSGHQAVEPAAYGVAGPFDPNTGEVQVTDIVIYPAACVNPPQGKTTEQWIREGFPGAQCPEITP